MSPEGKTPRPERDQTDEGLRNERKKTDQAITDRLDDIEHDATTRVDRARRKADAAVGVARAVADGAAPAGPDDGAAQRTIEDHRAIADAAVVEERQATDATLERELAEQVRVLAGLLPLEREQTDRYLLSERARADDALANRDDFLGVVSHDLRNLLSGIVLSANALSGAVQGRGDEVEGRTVACTDRIQRYAARMNRLIGDLLDVISIDAGRLAVHPVRGDAGAMLAEAIEAFAPAASARGVALVLEIPAEPIVGAFDHDRMFQVLANLITNAIKFTPEHGCIAVRGSSSDRDILIDVVDTGSGIPEAQLEAVFERFWQVGQRDRRGLGLGLYISRCIVAAHGGTIRVTSKMGQGSAFQVSIPRAAASPA